MVKDVADVEFCTVSFEDAFIFGFVSRDVLPVQLVLLREWSCLLLCNY